MEPLDVVRCYGPRPVYDDCVFDLSELLTARARRWLEYQTDEDQQRFMSECTSNYRNFRSLHLSERVQQAEWVQTRDMDDEAYEKYAAWFRDGMKHLGTLMADQLYETATRPGFLRRFFAPPKHTVPEGTDAEFKLARRIQLRLRPLRPIRAIIQQLHAHTK